MENITELANILDRNLNDIEDYEERMRVRRTLTGLYYALRAEIGVTTPQELADEILKK